MTYFIKSLTKAFFLIILSFELFSQGGTIEGVVYDAKTRERLVGATAVIQGTTIGTTANLNGEFRLANIQQEKVSLLISFISYEPVIIENINMDRGRVVNLEIELNEVSYQLEGVTVTARRTNYTETALISALRNSQVVTSGISAQQISRSQDSDAAQVVRRIPGVTIIDDRFIVVRGLGERYNTVWLHNVAAPSMEADVRSFSFDIIPSSQIEQLLIFKSPSPDLPGDFAGGAIKIFTKSIPDKSGFEFSYSNRYDHGTTFQPFFHTERPSNSWLGLGSDYFSLPDDFPSDLRTVESNKSELERFGKGFRNNWVPEQTTAWLNQSAALTGSFRARLAGVNIGNITTLTYSNSNSTNSIFRTDNNAYFMGQYDDQGNVVIPPYRSPIYEFDDARYSNQVKIGVLNNWGIEFKPGHSVEIINLYNQISSYNYVNRVGPHIDFGAYFNNHNFQQIFRGLYSGQVTGKHELTPTTKLDWTGGYNTSFRDMPDYKQYRSDRNINDVDGPFNIYVPTGGAQPYFMGRFHSYMNEEGHSYGFNISQKITLKSIPSIVPEVKAGVFSSYMERDFVARNLGYTATQFPFPQHLRALTIDSLFNPYYLNITQPSGAIEINEQSNPQDSYYTSNDLLAWYGMIIIPVADKFNFSGGLRRESNRRILKSATTTGPVNEDDTRINNLWSANMSYNITEKLLLRAGFGQTVNRPELRELAPFGFFDFDNNWVVRGNQYLKTAEINNYDLRLEFYPTVSEVVSIAGFYKDFQNAIERVTIVGAGSGGSKNFSFGNADEAVIYGMETEIRKNLLGLTSMGFLDDFSIYFNGALMKSNVVIGAGSLSEGRDTDPRPLEGQSSYIVNAGLFYNNLERDLQVNVLYNIIGTRLFSGGVTTDATKEKLDYADVYELPRNLLEVTISKRLSRNMSIKAGIADIINDPIRFMQDANQDGIFNRKTDHKSSDPKKNTDHLLRFYRPGFTASVGLYFKF